MKKLQVTNRLLSLLLAMSMVFSCVPVSAHAAEQKRAARGKMSVTRCRKTRFPLVIG